MGNNAFVDLYTMQGECLNSQPWQAYPRPQLRRDSFLNLNGEWEFAVSASETAPAQYDRRILVPFSPETLLSGVHERFAESDYFYYRRRFSLPEDFNFSKISPSAFRYVSRPSAF